MQRLKLLRAAAAGNLPSSLDYGELALDALANPPKLYAGVPTTRDPSGRIDLLASADGGALLEIGSSAPVSPSVGGLWFNSTDLQLYIRYDDGDSVQWVPVTNQALTGGGNGGGPAITLPLAIAEGGTGATTQAGALSNLGGPFLPLTAGTAAPLSGHLRFSQNPARIDNNAGGDLIIGGYGIFDYIRIGGTITVTSPITFSGNAVFNGQNSVNGNITGVGLTNAVQVIPVRPSAAAPGSPTNGQMYYNTTTHTLNACLDSVWTTLATTGPWRDCAAESILALPSGWTGNIYYRSVYGGKGVQLVGQLLNNPVTNALPSTGTVVATLPVGFRPTINIGGSTLVYLLCPGTANNNNGVPVIVALLAGGQLSIGGQTGGLPIIQVSIGGVLPIGNIAAGQ